jgi:hypothetical protein
MTDTAELIARAELIEPYLCDPGCEGRCKDCPLDVVRAMKDTLATLGGLHGIIDSYKERVAVLNGRIEAAEARALELETELDTDWPEWAKKRNRQVTDLKAELAVKEAATIDLLNAAFGEYACAASKYLPDEEKAKFERNFAEPARKFIRALSPRSP